MLSLLYYKRGKQKSQQHIGGVTLKNQDIRRTAAGAGVKLWQIADKLGIADCNFSRKLRKELPQDEKEHIFSIIRELSGEVE